VRGFIDRIVDGVAVVLLEGGGRAYVPASSLPHGVEAGHLVEVVLHAVSTPQTADGAAEMAELIERLRAGDDQHDHHRGEHRGRHRR
jgi:hypothetical protein